MAKNIKWFFLVVAAALIQTSWPDFLKLQEVAPDLCLLLVVFFAIREGEERAMMTGLLGGIYQDIASTALLGHHVLCLVVVGYIAGRFSTRLVTEHPAVKVGLVFLAGIVSNTLFNLILFIQQPEHEVLYTIFNSVVPEAFYSALVTPVVFLLPTALFPSRDSFSGGTR